ncbi:MAG: HDOD domain-containing protein [Planctomycetes bacterium]|nr:HDOD domain-containing protein [Planctomycetota bacterium]
MANTNTNTKRKRKSSVHLLLADASEKVTAILQAALRQAGYQVSLSTDTRTAYLKAVQLRPDVVVVDAALPPDGGLRLVHTLRSHPICRSIPAILKGTPPELLVGPELDEAGVHAALTRPLRFSELVARLEGALRSVRKCAPTDSGIAEAQGTGEGEAEDAALLLDPKALPSVKLERVCQRAQKLAAFPFVIARALAITSDEHAGAKDLASCIRSDPGLAGNVLKVANTVHFARRGRAITDVSDAIVRIGFRETKRLVVAMPFLRMFPARARSHGLDRVEFWLHCLAVGCLAGELARRSGYPAHEEAFIAGLLHDVGKLILDECFPEVLDQVLERCTAEQTRMVDAERALLGIAHPQIGEILQTRWNLPRVLRDATLYHHDLGRASEALSGASLQLARLVDAAGQVSKALALGGAGDSVLVDPGEAVWRSLGLPMGLRLRDLEGVYRELNMYREFLSLATGPIEPRRETEARRGSTVLWVRERPQGASLLDLLLEERGYGVVPLGRQSEVPVDLILVEAEDMARLDEYQALASSGPEGRRIPLVLVSRDPYEVAEEARAHTASIKRPLDARGLEGVLDTLLLGQTVARPPLVSPEVLRAEEEALEREVAGRLRDSAVRRGDSTTRMQTLRAPAAEAPTSTAAPAPATTPAPAPTPTATTTTPSEAAPGSPHMSTVLVVDDNLAIRIALQKLIASGGYRVLTCASGVEALERLRAEAPQLLVLDVMMPMLDGLQVLEQLRQEERFRGLPVILCTAVRDKERVVQAARLGVSGYIVKPFDRKTILAKVAQALAPRGAP